MGDSTTGAAPSTAPDGPGDPDAPVRTAWVAVRAVGGQPIGAGVVVADGHVLTCAHVLNEALGRPARTTTEPAAGDLARIALTLPAYGPRGYRPELVRWSAPAPGGGQGWWDGDLALLRLPPDAPRVPPVRLGDAPLGNRAWAWHADGDGRSGVDVWMQKHYGPWLLLDPGNAELPIRPGYSGGPLWRSDTGTLAGVIVSVEPATRRYYAIGPAAVRDLLAGAGLSAARPRDPRQAWLHEQLTESLAALPAERYRRGTDRFTRALGLPRGDYRPDETADAALAHPRGGPALRDAYTEPADPEGPLAAAAARAGQGRLLAPADHERLLTLLSGIPLADLLAAARQAVPYLPLHAGRLPDTAAFVDCLEDRAADPGVMPPLLQVAEEVAALRPRVGEELREWSGRVAARLRVRPGALDQVRADAKRRADHRGAGRPVLRVWLWDLGRSDDFTYVIRLYDADDRPLFTWAARDVPSGHEEVCRQLAEAVRRLSDYGENAGVEFLLEYGSFGLPIDRWPIPVPDVGPRRLGVDRFVVLRGQQRAWRGPWERRWGSLGAAAASVLHDVESADDLLGEDLDAALVIAACPQQDVDRMVRLCRHYGVPVMLWHRQAAGEDAAAALLELVGEDRPHDLREEVRRRRLKARRDDQLLGAHLALLWEDPRWDPGTAQLTEPQPV